MFRTLSPCFLIESSECFSCSLSPSIMPKLAVLLHSQARNNKGRTTRVLFIWIIRDNSHVNWIAPALRTALASPTNDRHPLDLDVQIFVTQGSPKGVATLEMEEQSSVPSPTSEEIKGSKEEAAVTPSESTTTLVEVMKAGGGRAKFVSGRPDIRRLMEEELAASNGLDVSVDGEPVW